MGRLSKYRDSCNGTQFDSNDCNDFVHNLQKRVKEAATLGNPIPMDKWGVLKWHIAEIITSHCPICKEEMVRNYGGKHQERNSPECDRIIPEKGYVVGNIQIICHSCNVAKDGRSMRQFWELVCAGYHMLSKEAADAFLEQHGLMRKPG